MFVVPMATVRGPRSTAGARRRLNADLVSSTADRGGLFGCQPIARWTGPRVPVMVPRARFELARGCPQRCLRPPRLPVPPPRRRPIGRANPSRSDGPRSRRRPSGPGAPSGVEVDHDQHDRRAHDHEHQADRGREDQHRRRRSRANARTGPRALPRSARSRTAAVKIGTERQPQQRHPVVAERGEELVAPGLRAGARTRSGWRRPRNRPRWPNASAGALLPGERAGRAGGGGGCGGAASAGVWSTIAAILTAGSRPSGHDQGKQWCARTRRTAPRGGRDGAGGGDDRIRTDE